MVLVVEQHGTFVYRVVQRIAFRSKPEVGDNVRMKDGSADGGDMFAVDSIQPSRVGAINGARDGHTRSRDLAVAKGERLTFPV